MPRLTPVRSRVILKHIDVVGPLKRGRVIMTGMTERATQLVQRRITALTHPVGKAFDEALDVISAQT